jgi:ligand-binding sensor domain-containing protein
MVDVVTSDGADLWVGTPRGLFRIEEGFAVYMPLGLPSERVHDVLRSRDGQLWIATSQGIASWDGATTRQLDTAQGLPSRIVYALAETEDGALWGGTDNGAFRWGPTDLLIFTRERGTLPHDWVTSLVADGNAVLAGTYDAGVVRLTADGRSEVIAGLDLAWVNPHGIARQGAEWFVSTLGGGLLRRTPDGGVVSVTALPSSDVTAVSWFGGELWVGTRNGLARPAL